MRKIGKLIIFMIKFTAFAALVNYHIKLLVNKLKGDKDEDEHIYDYRFGEVNYIKRGSGPAMLLLHGPVMNACKSEWEPLISCLEKDYTVYAPDLPGFGRSEHPEISYSSYLYASFINDFIDDVIEEPAIVMGSGKSADFSVCAAKLAPENFKKLVLISPQGFSEVAQKCPIRAVVKKVIAVPIYGTFVFNMLWLGLFARDFIRNLPDKCTPNTMQSAKLAMAAIFNGDMDLDVRDEAKKTGIPTFIALGNTDPISGISSDIETRLFCDAAGAPHLGDDSRAFVDEVNMWLKR